MFHQANSPHRVDVSVVVCTWNRCRLLRETLESMTLLTVPDGIDWELLVVNNNSTDGTTEEVLSEFRNRLPLRSIHEPKQGVSRARNTAVKEARGELLLFTDDDVRIDAGWMAAFLTASRQSPDADFFAGEILPRFESPPQRWIADNLATLHGMLVIRNLGPLQRPLRTGEFPYGPNMALRRAVFQNAEFNEQVGRKGDEQIRCGETSIFLVLAEQGRRGVWVPEAKLTHFVPVERLSLSALWAFYQGIGQAECRLGRRRQSHPARRMAKSLVKAATKRILRRTDWVRHLTRAAYARGQLVEAKNARAIGGNGHAHES